MCRVTNKGRKGFVMDPYMSFFFMFTISFPEALVVSFFAITFMGGKPRIPAIIIIAAIQSIVAYIVRSLPIPVGMHTIFLAVSYMILISLIARVSIGASSIGVISVLIVNIITEVGIIRLVTDVTGLSIADLVNDKYRRLMFTVPITVVMFIIAILFRRFDITFVRITGWQSLREKYKIYHDPGSSILYREYFPTVVFVLLPILLLWLINYTSVTVQIDRAGDYTSHFKVLFNGLVIILAFMSLWSVQRIRRSIEKEIEAASAVETVESMKELIMSIRKQRHDFNNQLQTVYGLIETGSFDEARKYINNTYHYVSGTGELIKTDNPGISALIYTKIGIAETKNIKYDIIIDCSLEGFPLNGNEASSLLGNLIDNAFDGVEENESGSRQVRLYITAERGEYIIEVANQGELDRDLLEKIFIQSFTTKKGHSGLGLGIIKEIVDRYRGSIQVLTVSGEIVFRVSIPFGR